MGRPFRASTVLATWFQGLRPWLSWVAPSGLVVMLLVVVAPLAAEDPLDALRERIDDGDPDAREECLALLEKDPTSMRAWAELFHGASAPRDQDLLDRAERVRASWERRARGKPGPIVAAALALLVVRGSELHEGRFTIVVGPGGDPSGFTSPAVAAAESLVRRAERFAPEDPWVVYARFLLDRAEWHGEDVPRRTASLASPVFAVLEKDPGNIVLLEALSLLPPSTAQERAEKRLIELAATAHPRLLPAFRMASVSHKGGRTDVEALEGVFRETLQDSLYLDDVAWRLAEAYHRQLGDASVARRWYEELVGLDRGGCLGRGLLAFADLLVDEFDEPARAVELLRAYVAKGLSTRGDGVGYASWQVLFRIGEIQRGRLHAPREAAESFLDGLAQVRAVERDVEAYAYYYLAAGDCLAEAGDPRGAMSLYGQYQATSEVPVPEIWSRWMTCYLRVSPYFTISMGLTLLLTALSGVLAIVVLVSRWSRTRRYLLAAVVLTLLVGGIQVIVHGVALGVPREDLAWTGLLSMRTFLVVPAGMALAAAVGIRTPRARILARSVVAGLVAGLLMGAVTWALLLWKTPTPSDLLRFLWDPLREGELGAVLEPSKHPVAAVLLVITAGVAEEITCRLFFLGLLVRSMRAVPGRWTISILLVSFFWAIAHAGMVEPESWKLAQVFAMGLILGLLAKREGILACIFAHAAFNAVGVWV